MAVCLLFLCFCKQTADFVYIFQLFVYILSFVNKQLISQFSAVCLHFSCLFTFQLFVYFLSFVNKQLFVYFLSFVNKQLFVYILSAVCLLFLSFSCLFTFLSAVCLHFVSRLFTFLSFCKQTADFSVFSCLFTFFSGFDIFER